MLFPLPRLVWRACLLALVLPTAASAFPLTILGTNDLHGRVERTAAFSSFVNTVRAARRAEGGGVVLVDAGDMFQGTLESNLVEGKSVVQAYNALRYDAVAVGNHEFDFGPVGPHVTAKAKGEDPQGVLKARAAQAHFPFLMANVVDEKTGLPPAWKNVRASTVVTVQGVRIGIIGATTIDTPRTTVRANLAGLRVEPVAEAITKEANALRKAGVGVIVVVAHVGGRCEVTAKPAPEGECEHDQEVMGVLQAIPAGTIDAFFAGHTHAPMANTINGVPVVEAWANGKGFSRIDFDVDVRANKATVRELHRPHVLCGDDKAAIEACVPGNYDGSVLAVDKKMLRALAPTIADAQKARARKLGVKVTSTVRRGYDEESALGNLIVDMMLLAKPEHDVALTNGGGIRADFPAGDLTYGNVFETIPFDNRFATITMTGGQLRRMLEANLSARKGGIFSMAGMSAEIRCDGKAAHVTLRDRTGKPVTDEQPVKLLTTDFISGGGDNALADLGVKDADIVVDESLLVREETARLLKKRGGALAGDDVKLFDSAAPRLKNAAQKTARCIDPTAPTPTPTPTVTTAPAATPAHK